MNAYAELRMPAHYVDMSQKEMEYDGGWFGVALSIVGLAVSCAAAITKNKTLGYIGDGLTVAGAVFSFGISAPLAAAGKMITRRGIMACADAGGYYLAGAGLDAGSFIVGVATWQW